MRKVLAGALLWLGLVAGCNGEPTYSDVSFVTYNYTPWDLERVQIVDASGRVAATGMVPSCGGEGSISCCYTLKGTEFVVRGKAETPTSCANICMTENLTRVKNA